MTLPYPVNDAPGAELRISILHIPDCPSLVRARQGVRAAVELVGATAVVEEIEGPYPSPTVLIDGVEIDGYPLGSGAACRIDVPTPDQIAAAVRAARIRPPAPRR